MYHRYKVNKKNKKFFRLIAILLIISSVFFFGYRHRQFLFFWRYSSNKLVSRIESTNKIQDINKRRDGLVLLIKRFEHYKNENQVKPEAFFLSGKVYYFLGKTYLPASFSEMIIKNRLMEINNLSKEYFIKAIKNIKKGKALQDSDKMEIDYGMILAKSCFFSSYCNYGKINQILEEIEEPSLLKGIEDKRFYAIINILNKKIDYGLKFLNESGMINEGIQGRLFLATSYKIAEKYTGSIMKYKNIINQTSDKELLKLIHLNLGKIYYIQSLYKESLEHFNFALKFDKKDNALRIWIGKNYLAMGQKDKAKAIWTEVLTLDGANAEVKKLLGVM